MRKIFYPKPTKHSAGFASLKQTSLYIFLVNLHTKKTHKNVSIFSYENRIWALLHLAKVMKIIQSRCKCTIVSFGVKNI